MNIRYFAALLLAIVISLPAGAKKPAPLPVLTVENALDLACSHNPSLTAAQARIDQAKAQIDQARADKLPKLFASLAGAWQGKEGKVPAYTAVAPGHFVQSGYALNSFEEVYQASLGAQWLIFSSGAVENTVKARRLAFLGIKTREVRTGQAVENAVRVCYSDLQRARAKYTVAEEVLALTREHLSQVKDFFKYGVVAQDEVLRVQVDVANGELNVISAKNAVDVRWRALERAVGTPLRGVYSLPDPGTAASPAPVPAWNDESLFVLRPELRALDFSRRAALAVAAAAQGSTGPKIAATGEVFNMGREFWPNDLDTWKLSLSLRWDLYDGGKARAQVKEYRAKARELAAQIDDYKHQIALEVSSAQLNYEAAKQRTDVARRQVESAREDYRMALMRYKANVGTNLDVLDARTALNNARTQLVDAVYDTDSARAGLDYALGVSQRFSLDMAETPAARNYRPPCLQ